MHLRLYICTYLSKNIVFLNRAYSTRKYEQKMNWYLQKSKYDIKKGLETLKRVINKKLQHKLQKWAFPIKWRDLHWSWNLYLGCSV